MGGMLVLHDLPLEDLTPPLEGTTFFATRPRVDPCIGCFGCWVQTPGKCVFPFRGDVLTTLLAEHEQLVIVSHLVFGGLSPEIKAILDRCIGYVLPFFQIIDGEMHHARRYDTPLAVRFLLYGENMPAHEKETAHKLMAANALNLGAQTHAIEFFGTSAEAMEAIA